MNKKYILGFSMGDPYGIGPQITLDAIMHLKKYKTFIPVIFGSKNIFNRPFYKKRYENLSMSDYNVPNLSENEIYFVDCGDCPETSINKPSKKGGELSRRYIEKATEFALNSQIDALVTAPISKESLELSGSSFTGHTTMLKSLTNTDKVSMVFHSPKLNVVLATIHLPISEVSTNLTEQTCNQAIDSAILLMKLLGQNSPKIAVAGLNPHASENGLFGHEEKTVIEPSINNYQKKAIAISGPYSGDTIFLRASKGEFDVVVAMYHDQGLIPIKLLGFHDAVNITLGLPFVRTSPDHGTAFEIVYSDKVSAESMIAAVNCALKLLENT
tara:strand:- start:11225 stop:12208 length:984 start_codon:yes stop_codon:yes gene_type:complete